MCAILVSVATHTGDTTAGQVTVHLGSTAGQVTLHLGRWHYTWAGETTAGQVRLQPARWHYT